MLQRNDKNQKTILIAGGAGFLGSHLCDALIDEGHRVICVDSFLTSNATNLDGLKDHPRFRMLRHDVCTPLDIDEDLDQIYNLACPASPPHYQADPFHTMLTNVQGTANLLILAERHGASFIQASTSEVYGDPEEHPQREAYWGNVNCTGPRACYDEGKRAAEALCFDALRAGRADIRVARIFNTYGPRMQANDGRIVSNLIVQALRQEPLTIYGNGKQTRSFCYVSDLVRGLVSLMNVAPNPRKAINLGNPREFEIGELATMVLNRIETGSQVVYKPLPIDDPQRRRPDITSAKETLGWEPRVSLQTGLTATIDWFEQHLATSHSETTASRNHIEPMGAPSV
jgi:UDP-glucuronate decarboxylase